MSYVNTVAQMIFLCENIAFVLDNKYTELICAKLLIGHNLANLTSGAFSLDMSILDKGTCI